jgi:hypothetical protein
VDLKTGKEMTVRSVSKNASCTAHHSRLDILVLTIDLSLTRASLSSASGMTARPPSTILSTLLQALKLAEDDVHYYSFCECHVHV